MFYREMEKQGLKHNLVLISIDDRFIEKVYDSFEVSVSLEELQGIANKCLANEWLSRNTMGDPFSNLNLSQKGLGVVRSKQLQREQNNTLFKKTSNFATKHKALVGVLLSLIGLGVFVLKIHYWS